MADRKITELSAADSTDISSSNAVLHLVNPDRVADADKNRKLALKSNVVLTSETQTVGGAKTFSSDVTVPNLVVGDGGNIGSASDTDAITISSGGDVAFSQDITVKDGGTIGSASATGAIKIDSGGDVGIGGTPEISGVHIKRATGTASPTPAELRIETTENASDWSTTDPWGRLSFYMNDTSGGGKQIHSAIDATSLNSTGGVSYLTFKMKDTSANLNDVMRLDYNGNVTISNGTLIMGTSGEGIDFSANANAAGMTSELLDDYEEGTWTPAIAGLTASKQQGKYVKIGNLVFVSLTLEFSGGSATDNDITGLPFAAATTTDWSTNSDFLGEIAGAVSGIDYYTRVSSGGSQIRIVKRTTTSHSSVSNAEVPQSVIRTSFCYSSG